MTTFSGGTSGSRAGSFFGAGQPVCSARISAGRPQELLLALMREGTPAVVGPAFRVALVGDRVTNEVDVQAGLPEALAWCVGPGPALQSLRELLPFLALHKGAEGFRIGHHGAEILRLAGAAFRVDAHREGDPARDPRPTGRGAEVPQVPGGDYGVLVVAEIVLQRL